jgi:hypothetical protein
MKPRTDLIVNAVALFVVSPLLGMLVAGFAVGLLEVFIWTVAGSAGLISSIFFDVDLTAIDSLMPIIRRVEIWLIFGGGIFGGIIWCCFEIRENWQRYKATGKGW